MFTVWRTCFWGTVEGLPTTIRPQGETELYSSCCTSISVMTVIYLEQQSRNDLELRLLLLVRESDRIGHKAERDASCQGDENIELQAAVKRKLRAKEAEQIE
ncbi:hypothetical protein R1flu_018635 [Riccia fluitans]|uniref:Uncharacterized protein n=1 Tax=Riccia fluitans TaxID=41844 RepID=A0ABD1ZGF0_9MARC